MSVRGQQLHDKVTRGDMLTPEEQQELVQWYAQEDHIEEEALHVSALTDVDAPLQRQVRAALDQLQLVTHQIQELAVENDLVRRDISDLRRRLAQRRPSHAA